ncbi:hypothetical protein [Priestia megaterium]|uniref:hypothetical protein n=1 Tax=Priestia megaterium TaxID=1404 RepID=UPI000BFEA4A9|nr:hypothetical protein [Priestia megaterium]PGO60736.1 hypothetical protein CN981_09365 [Priestia megaterium]
MNITQEKEYLYGMMKDMIEEKRQMTDMIHGVKKRLDHLHNLELRGIEELSTEGYIDLYNRYSRTTATNNIERETNFMLEKMGTPSMATQQHVSREQSVAQEEFAEKVKKHNEERLKSIKQAQLIAEEDARRVAKNIENSSKRTIEEINREPEEPKTKGEMIVEGMKKQDHLSGKKVAPEPEKEKSKRLNIPKVEETIIKVLKEAGRPMQLKELIDKTSESYGQEINTKNFSNNIITRLAKKDKKLTKPSFGFYQYMM